MLHQTNPGPGLDDFMIVGQEKYGKQDSVYFNTGRCLF